MLPKGGVKMKNDKYTTYVPEIGAFITLRHLTSAEIATFVEDITIKFNKCHLEITDYVDLVVSRVVPQKVFDTIARMQKEGKVSDLIGPECLFSSILSVYPVFEMSNISTLANDISDLGVHENALEEEKAGCNTLAGINKLRKDLAKKIIGQEEAIDAVIDPLKLLGAGIESSATLFFIGPTGVGKTELAKTLSDSFLGRDKLIKINCGEYSAKHEYSKLIGSPPGYVGHDKSGLLTEKAAATSQWVFLFDEIEKASDKLFDLLLSLLDDGTIMDSQGQLLDFSNSLFLFTSNIGLQDNMGKKEIGFGKSVRSYADSMAGIEEAFKAKFKPEFINRIDKVVYFNTLSKKDASKIARLHMGHLPLKLTKKFIDYVVDNSFSEEYGARNIKRFIKNDVATKVADMILGNGTGDKYTPVITDGNLSLEILPAKSAEQ